MIREKLSGQVVLGIFFHFPQFNTDAVQVMAELVSDSSKHWSLIKIQNLLVELF